MAQWWGRWAWSAVHQSSQSKNQLNPEKKSERRGKGTYKQKEGRKKIGWASTCYSRQLVGSCSKFDIVFDLYSLQLVHSKIPLYGYLGLVIESMWRRHLCLSLLQLLELHQMLDIYCIFFFLVCFYTGEAITPTPTVFLRADNREHKNRNLFLFMWNAGLPGNFSWGTKYKPSKFTTLKELLALTVECLKLAFHVYNAMAW